jgi:uncharacterized protein
MPDVLVNSTYGGEDPERATVPYIVASTAAASGQLTAVVCTAEGVWTGTSGYADRVAFEGMAPLRELYDALVAAGGEIWLCSACTNVRGITDYDLAEGARIVGAAQIVAAVTDGATMLSLT